MIAIVKSEFNQKVTCGLLDGCLSSFKKNGIQMQQIDIYEVPGAFELPAKIKFLASSNKKYKAIIALGCIIKGETDHYHYISDAVANGIMSVTLEINNEFPKIIFGVLTCQNKELAYARSNNNFKKNKGAEAAHTTLKLLDL